MKYLMILVLAVLIAFAAWWGMNRHDERRSAQALYPYVIPEEYPVHRDAEAAGIVRPLGHGLRVTLVFDVEGAVVDAGAEDIEELGMTPEQAYARALANLERLAETQQVKMAAFPSGPSEKPFVLVGGHWAAATSILLPRLRKLVEGPLGAGELCIAIPHREAMLIFPGGDEAHREAVRAFVRKNESYAKKRLTFGLFTFGPSGIEPIADEDRGAAPEPAAPASANRPPPVE